VQTYAPARSALQRAADIYDQLPSVPRLPDSLGASLARPSDRPVYTQPMPMPHDTAWPTAPGMLTTSDLSARPRQYTAVSAPSAAPVYTAAQTLSDLPIWQPQLAVSHATPVLQPFLDTPIWLPRCTESYYVPPQTVSSVHADTKPEMVRATAFYDRLSSVPECPAWLYRHYISMSGTSVSQPPIQTTPVYTAAAPRSSVLPPLPGFAGTVPPSAPPPPVSAQYLTVPTPQAHTSQPSIPHTYIYTAPTLTIQADTQGAKLILF